MDFSIIIPTYNGERYIRETLKSACSQERPADEIIISDDGSTDGTLKICRSYEFRDRVKIYENSDGPSGFVNGWKRAIERSNCDYVTLLHQDDLLHDSYLRIVAEALRVYPNVGHVYAACNYIDRYGNIIKKPPEPWLMKPRLYTGKEYRHNLLRSVLIRKDIHRCPGVTTSRKLFSMCTYRDEAGHIADNDFFYRIGNYTDVIGISAPLASFRHHEKSETGRLNDVELVLRLAKDYTFQSKFHSNCEYFEMDDIAVLNELAIKYINSLLNYGLMLIENRYVRSALELKNDINPVLKRGFYSYLPFHHKAMWIVLQYFEKTDLHFLYMDIIRYLKLLKKSLQFTKTK
jgi:glycosyltransferase involved in cell wall biosynthesis